MADWHPERYLRFEEERTRPCRDLASQIRSASVRTVIDLGCGPGNSTAVLAARWPAAKITGLDSSSEMLDRARGSNPRHEWIEADIAAWAMSATSEHDIVFSNAALQWVDNHAAVYPRLMDRVAPGGSLAVQVPSNLSEPAHQIMRDLAASQSWRGRLTQTTVREWFVHDAGFYYDVLAASAADINIWETTYIHQMPDVESIAEWYRATGLRPFLHALGSDADREQFIRDYIEAIRPVYQVRPDGRVLLPFRRLFLVASKHLRS